MYKSRKEQGMTLVVLVIMIIMLLILVTVSVNIVVKKDIFNQAKRAENKTTQYVQNQQDVHQDVRDLYR